MEQKNQRWNRLLKVIFEYSGDKLTLREISRRTGIPLSTLMRNINQLQKERIINKEYMFIENTRNRWRKTERIISLIFESGLIDFLEEKLKPSVIILFGSMRKGEYEKDSDIDLFVEASEREINLKPFEKKLEHSIHLIVKNRLSTLPKELQLSIINGIKLSGYLKYES